MKKNKFQKIIIHVVVLFILIIPVFVFAANTLNAKIQNPLSDIKDIWALIAKIVDFIVKVGAAIVVLFVIWTGYKFVVAQGNEQKITEAKQMLFWTLVGALILLGAKALSEVICNTAASLGANISCSSLMSNN